VPTHMIVVCDRCRLKHDMTADPEWSEEFIREHVDHNFTGLRIVPEDFPCPNALRRYSWDMTPVRRPNDRQQEPAPEVLRELEEDE